MGKVKTVQEMFYGVEDVKAKAGQQAGGIAPTEYDEDQNEIPGYVTKVPLAANLTAVQKASRKLKGVSFQARIAGAIHMVEINGNLTYDNL